MGGPLRRSARLRPIRDPSLLVGDGNDGGCQGRRLSIKNVVESALSRSTAKAKARTTVQTSESKTTLEDVNSNEPEGGIGGTNVDCLGRPREREVRQMHPLLLHVMGIDEAGRGPLAGPVVAAAAIVPTDVSGIVDSKRITDEVKRELLYERIVTSPNVRLAVAVVDAKTIDEINILQATLLGMRMAAESVMSFDSSSDEESKFRRVSAPCISIQGCYVVTGGTDEHGQPCSVSTRNRATNVDHAYYALVDGDRVPSDMPCRAEAIIKGDSKEYGIAAASILAKVTRDRLMHAYSNLYPEYNLSQHKGYPTLAHKSAIRTHGPCPIHRRTYGLLKDMELEGRAQSVVTASSSASARTSRNYSTTSTTTGSDDSDTRTKRRSRSCREEGSSGTSGRKKQRPRPERNESS